MCGRIQFLSHILVFGNRDAIMVLIRRQDNQLVVIGMLLIDSVSLVKSFNVF